jgi:phage shock protein A
VGIFDRISSVFKGRASTAMNKLESANPEAVYEAAIMERQKQYQEMKRAAADLAVVRKRSQEELDDKRRKLSEVDPMVHIAIESGEEEAALVLLEEKQTLTDRIAVLEPEIESFNKQITESTSALRAYQVEVEKLRREKDEMVSRKVNAEAQLQIQDTLSTVSTSSQNQGLANVREKIERLAVDADLETSSARRVVTEKLSRSRAASQLAALKQQLAEKNGTATPSSAPAEPDSDAPAAAPASDVPKRTL